MFERELFMLQIEDLNIKRWREDCRRRQYHEIQDLKAELQRVKRTARIYYSGQSHRMSAIESMANVAVGFGVSLLANITILPLFGYSPGLMDATFIGVAFTAISLIRSYLMRRLFNWIGIKYALASK